MSLKNKIIEVCKLRSASEEQRDNKDIVMEAVKKNELELVHASDRLKNDKDVVLAAVKRRGWAFEYASEELKNDREVVFEALKSSHDAKVVLEHAGEKILDDKETMMAAIRITPSAYDYASSRLKEDKDVQVLHAKVMVLGAPVG